MSVARVVLEERFTGEDGLQMLYVRGGVPYEWYGGNRWVGRDEEWMEDELWSLLDCCVEIQNHAQGQVVKPFRPTKGKVADVMRALYSLVRYPYQGEPAWMDGRMDHVDTKYLIAFRDVVVGVKETAEKWDGKGPIEWVTEKRTAALFTPVVIPVNFEDARECPNWERAMDDWSGGDEVWKECRMRSFAYCLMAQRDYAKWFMEYGKVRGGKGLGSRAVLSALLGGEPGFVSKSIKDLMGSFGLDRVEHARVLLVPEATDMTKVEMRQMSSLLKQIVGRDPVDVNAKFQRQRGHQLGCVPLIQANEMLSLPNAGRGVTSKMVALPFDVSFAGREDYELEEKLLGELPGIARKVAEAAVRLVKAPPQEKFVMPERSKEVIRRFEMRNNPVQAFLDARFVEDRNGRVSNETLRAQRKSWEQMSEMQLLRGDGTYASQMHLPSLLLEGTTWALSKLEWRLTTGQKVRGLKGLRVRRETRDD